MKDPYFRRRLKIGAPPYKLDIGCKRKRLAGFIGIDFRDFDQDVVWDVLEGGLPFPDGSVTEINMSHFLEHVPDEKLTGLWQEIIRVCALGTFIHIRNPHAKDVSAFWLWHCSFWNPIRIQALGTQAIWDKRFRVIDNRIDGTELKAKLQVVAS
jgi:hypothetical protein